MMRSTQFRRFGPWVAVMVTMAVVAACSSEAEEGDPFYAGESIRYIVPTAPGGGADAIAQFLNPYWREHIPGNPSVDIDYVPGAGGIAGANEFVLRVDADGLTVMQSTLSTSTAFLLGEEEVQYNMGDWNPVIAFPTSGVIYGSTDLGVESVTELLDYDGELVVGGRSPTASDIMHVLALEVLGLRDKVNHVWGYEGTGEQILAFEQGETNLDATTDTAWINNAVQFVDAGLALPLVSYGLPDGQGGFDRNPAIDAPTVDEAYEAMHGSPPSGPAWDAFVTVMDVMSVATVVVLPEGSPEEARAAFRQAVDEMVAETDFIEEATQTLNPNEPIYEEAALESARQGLTAIDEQMQSWIRQFLEDNYPNQMG